MWVFAATLLEEHARVRVFQHFIAVLPDMLCGNASTWLSGGEVVESFSDIRDVLRGFLLYFLGLERETRLQHAVLQVVRRQGESLVQVLDRIMSMHRVFHKVASVNVDHIDSDTIDVFKSVCVCDPASGWAYSAAQGAASVNKLRLDLLRLDSVAAPGVPAMLNHVEPVVLGHSQVVKPVVTAEAVTSQVLAALGALAVGRAGRGGHRRGPGGNGHGSGFSGNRGRSGGNGHGFGGGNGGSGDTRSRGGNGSGGHVDRRQCWECGQTGHIRSGCPAHAQTRPRTPTQIQHVDVDSGQDFY